MSRGLHTEAAAWFGMWGRYRWCLWLHTGDGGHRGASPKPKSGRPHSGKPGTEQLEGRQKTDVMCVLGALLFSWEKIVILQGYVYHHPGVLPFHKFKRAAAVSARNGQGPSQDVIVLPSSAFQAPWSFVIVLQGQVLALIAQSYGRGEGSPLAPALSKPTSAYHTRGITDQSF